MQESINDALNQTLKSEVKEASIFTMVHFKQFWKQMLFWKGWLIIYV